MAEYVAVLAETRAILGYCANAQDGASASLQLLELQLRVDDLVADITDYYEDDALHVTYYIVGSQMLESSQLRLKIESTYPNCKGGFAENMASHVSEAELNWSAFKARH